MGAATPAFAFGQPAAAAAAPAAPAAPAFGQQPQQSSGFGSGGFPQAAAAASSAAAPTFQFGGERGVSVLTRAHFD
eukprot:SAG25_NODE_996_length_4357_cov_1.644752_4_plen_76_part_00